MKKVPIIELFLSIISFWWAAILFLNHNMFDNVPSIYERFAAIQEYGWGFIFVTAALFKILGILLENYWLRRIGLSFSFFLYGLISAGYILSSQPLNPGTGVHFALCVLAVWELREVRLNGRNKRSLITPD